MEKLNINISGNKKLKNNENVRFMIWNIPAVKTCPFRTQHCEKSCYARKAERIYPQVLPSRERNYEASLSGDFVENMIYTIESELKTKKYVGKTTVFRIHESGDFYNMEYAKKWIAIAKHFENDNRIVFLAYTKSIIYFAKLGFGTGDFPNNLVIRSSLWDDTKDCNLELTKEYDFPIYTALSQNDMDNERKNGRNFTFCHCTDCAACGKCWIASEKDIVCKIH